MKSAKFRRSEVAVKKDIPQKATISYLKQHLETSIPSSVNILSNKMGESHYASVEELRQQQQHRQIQFAATHHNITEDNNQLVKGTLISVQSRPLPPVPPPRKSRLLSPQKFHQNNQQHNQSHHHNHLQEASSASSSASDNNFDISARSDNDTISVSSIYEQISPKKCVKSSVIVKTSTSQLQFQNHFHRNVNNNGNNGSINRIPAASFSVAELATRFLEENVRNCIKPRIFPMETVSPFNERTSTPYVFSTPAAAATTAIAATTPTGESIISSTRIHHHREQQQQQQRRLIFAPSLVMDRFLASKTALVSKTRSLTTSLGSFSQQNLQTFQQGTRMSSVAAANNASALPLLSIENVSPSKNKIATMSYQKGSRVDFASALKKWSAPIPPSLSRKLGRAPESPLGKVKVMLRVCDQMEEVSGSGILGLDKRRKQVTLIDPGGSTPSGITPEERRVGISAPKMFAFDGIFAEDDDQVEICSASTSELVASVMGGEDGCFVSLGHCSSGKQQTMFGKPANQKMGAIPTAISWLFKSILEQKQKTGARFSVRASAVEVTGGSGQETVNDLLLPFINDGDDPPGALLENTSGGVSNTNFKSSSAPVLNSVSEVRAPNPETVGFFLDSALDTMNRKEEPVGHFVFTLHVYQYSIDKNGKGVAGGRSRLHFIMLGNGAPSISVLGGLLLAVLNGQRHLPSISNHSKLGAILRECLGSLTCRAVVMIHVSNVRSRYAETLAALQLGSRVHRLRRSRRLKMGSVGSGNGSGGSSGGSGEETRNVIGMNNQILGEGDTGSSDIDPSSSEQSCDTVIYLGPSIDEATDGESPPVYLPSLETTPGENGAKIIPSKCPVVSGSNGPPPKTKSPRPKSSKNSTEGNFNGKGEEQWVDGPKVGKYRQLNGSQASSSGTNNTSQQQQSPAKKKGETWIDGPAAARVQQHQASNFPSPKKVPGNVHQQQRNGALPNSSTSRNGRGYGGSNGHAYQSNTSHDRQTCDVANCPTVCISATKAEMIQKWISNQTPSTAELLDEFSLNRTATHNHKNPNDVAGLLTNQPQISAMNCCSQNDPHQTKYGNIYTCHCLAMNGSSVPLYNNELTTEPHYKALTVFKTCEDGGEEDQSLCNVYDFEFIEVEEPEVPVPTCDVCLQVTEEDIALSYLEENPLPESDQNIGVSSQIYFSKGRSSSFSEISSTHSINSNTNILPKLNKDEQDHPLRVLSQECLTVVSSFADNVSIAGAEMERFWPRLSFPSDLNDTSQDIYQSFCKTLPNSPAHQNHHTLSSRLEQMSTENNKPPSSLLLRDLPILSDESIFKVTSPPPPVLSQKPSSKASRLSAIQSKKYRSGKESSDAEGESLKIPPMEIIDTTPITQTCNIPVINTMTQVKSITVALPTAQQQPPPPQMLVDMNNLIAPHPPTMCDQHNHITTMLDPIFPNGNGSLNGSHHDFHLNGSGGSIQSSPSRSTLTPPSSPSPLKLPDVTKSPSKSKSRKLSKFFRARSKSPKTAGATSSSESGKSSVSSDAKHSSSSSSCSSGASAPLTCPAKQKNHPSPKHTSPSRHQSPSKKQSSRKNSSCFSSGTASSINQEHFNCDSMKSQMADIQMVCILRDGLC